MKIVTFACDLYADIAPTYDYLLHKNWPDCPYDQEYVTNSVDLKIKAPVHYIKGQDVRYAWRLRQYIQKQCKDDELLLLMMIDYLVTSVDQERIFQAVELLHQPDIVHVRLRPAPAPQLPYEAKGFGEIKRPSRYSLSLQPGIWTARTIYSLCQDNENAYQTETRGSGRTGQVQGRFLCSEETVLSHVNYYRKKKVLTRDVDWVKAQVPEALWPNAAKE